MILELGSTCRNSLFSAASCGFCFDLVLTDGLLNSGNLVKVLGVAWEHRKTKLGERADKV